MRLFSVAGIAALSASNLVSAGGWFGTGDVAVNGAEKVPGDSPLQFCDGDHARDVVRIEKVDLLPNPPESYVRLFLLFPSAYSLLPAACVP